MNDLILFTEIESKFLKYPSSKNYFPKNHIYIYIYIYIYTHTKIIFFFKKKNTKEKLHPIYACALTARTHFKEIIIPDHFKEIIIFK